MNSQSKLDLAAGGAIATMLVGACALTISSFALILIAGGAIVMLLLFVKSFQARK